MQENQGTYFVGRAELVGWINSVLALNYTKIEQTHNGAAACQILDAVHPGSVAFGKVNFNAATEYEMINNYKILQAGFNKLNIQKSVDVNKLIKGKPLDNIEFMQWLKSYYDRITAGAGVQGYDGANRRAHSKAGAKRPSTGVASRTTAAAARPASARAATAPTGAARPRAAEGSSASASGHHSPMNNGRAQQEIEGLNTKVGTLAEELAVAEHKRSEVESERDFYFSKLREIELLCQAEGLKDQFPIMQAVENILYAATEPEGQQERQSTMSKWANKTL